MFKNTASTFLVFAFDTTNNTAKTGDAANITAYVSIDGGAVTVLGDTSATELDSTNAKGYYSFTAAQAETNGDRLVVTAKSSTANIAVIGAPAVIYTRPQTGWLAPTVAARTLDVSAGGEAGIDWANIGSPTTAQNLSATNIDVDQVVASVSGAVGSVTGAVGSVTGNVGGNVTGSVGSVAAGGITAASIATGAIDADAVAADAVTEIQSGLATSAALSTVAGYIDTEIAAIITTLGTPAGASVSADIAAVQSDATAIKAKTDSLTFTVAGQVDANIESVNTVTVNGNGQAGTEWGP